jgi:Leucine Rich repeat
MKVFAKFMAFLTIPAALVVLGAYVYRKPNVPSADPGAFEDSCYAAQAAIDAQYYAVPDDPEEHRIAKEITRHGGSWSAYAKDPGHPVTDVSFGEHADLRAEVWDLLRQLPHLEEINLHQFQGPHDTLANLARFPSLKRLDLTWSSLTDVELNGLRNLTQLEELSIEATAASDAGIEALAGLTSMRRLDIGANGITDRGLCTLRGLKRLEHLYIESTRITDDGLECLKDLTNLRELMLPDRLIGRGLIHLKGLHKLHFLEISRSQLIDSDLAFLKDLNELEDLYLVDCPQLGDAGLENLRHLKTLRKLNLSGSRVSSAGLHCLSGLTNLEMLVLEGTRVSDSGLEALRPLSKLDVIYLRGTSVTPEGLRSLLKAIPKLRSM